MLGAWAVMTFKPAMPHALSFAAGAMIFVVVEEVVPESQQEKFTDISTLGFIGGSLIMMSADVGQDELMGSARFRFKKKFIRSRNRSPHRISPFYQALRGRRASI